MRARVKRRHDGAHRECRPKRPRNEEKAREHMVKATMALLMAAFACTNALAQQPPTRKFDDSGAPPFKVLKEGENPPLDAHDNFVIGPNYVPAPERKKADGV